MTIESRALTVESVPLASLRREWIALEDEVASRSVFMTWDFASTWWEHFRRARESCVLLVRDENRPVAILPLYIEERSLRLGVVRVLRNVGFADVVNPDFLDALVLPGREADVAAAVARELDGRNGWDFAEVSELDPLGSMVRIMRQWEDLRVGELHVERRSVCPYIELPETFDAYLMARKPHFRHQLRRYRRKIERDLGVSWRQVGVDVDVSAGMEALARLHQERMEATDRGGNFRKQDYLAFHRDLAHRLVRSGRLFFWLLYVEGSPMATHYGFLDSGVYYGYQMGFAPRYHKWSPGHYMTGVVLEKLIELGAREMNLLRGTDSWKYRWTDTSRRTVTCALIRPGWRSRASFVRSSLSAPPAIALRSVIGRDGFEELRSALKSATELLRPVG